MRYYLFKILFGAIALLPFPILYLKSDFLFFLIYRVFGYRRKTVAKNLKIAFPERSEKERQKIAKAFYKNFCDMVLETIKMMGMNHDTTGKRFTGDVELLKQLHQKGKNVIIANSHQFNWEWALWTLSAETPYKTLCVYMTLQDKAIEKILTEIRSKHNAVMMLPEEIKATFFKYKNDLTATVLVGDQNPTNKEKCPWVNFFGKTIPFQQGIERIARMKGDAVVFIEIIKTGRGKYTNRLHLAFENPRDTKPGEITEAYVRFLEGCIRRQPENYLWTHNRWKYAKD